MVAIRVDRQKELFKKLLPPIPESVDACLSETDPSPRQSFHTQQTAGGESGDNRPEHALEEVFDFGFAWRIHIPSGSLYGLG
jgi:hypothetical protein